MARHGGEKPAGRRGYAKGVSGRKTDGRIGSETDKEKRASVRRGYVYVSVRSAARPVAGENSQLIYVPINS